MTNKNFTLSCGRTSDVKLKSLMTLFYLVDGNKTFKAILDKIFDGQLDAVIADQCEIKQMGCDCLYDFKSISKHQAAAFYALSDIVDNR